VLIGVNVERLVPENPGVHKLHAVFSAAHLNRGFEHVVLLLDRSISLDLTKDKYY
jgi:hypothetical protein